MKSTPCIDRSSGSRGSKRAITFLSFWWATSAILSMNVSSQERVNLASHPVTLLRDTLTIASRGRAERRGIPMPLYRDFG